MPALIGVFELKADSKGRVIFPSSLRKQLSADVSDGFVMKKSIFNPCIELFPLSTWAQETEKISQLNRFVKKNNDFIRLYMSGSRQVITDDAGRLLIPRDLMIAAGIRKDIVMSSAVDRIEIWSKEAYDLVIAAQAASFPTLAEEVMGQPGQLSDPSHD